MKEFDLEKAKAGEPVITNLGQDVRIISFDRKSEDFPIVGLISLDSTEQVECFTKEGIPLGDNPRLVMKPCKKIMYANFYFHEKNGYEIGFLYNNERNAKSDISNNKERRFIKTIKIEWEE